MTRRQELPSEVLQALIAADRKPGWNNRPREVKRFELGSCSLYVVPYRSGMGCLMDLFELTVSHGVVQSTTMGYRLDALAMAVKYWTDWLDRDVSHEEDRRNEELFDEELRKFEETVFGCSCEPDNSYDNYRALSSLVRWAAPASMESPGCNAQYVSM